MKDLFRLREEPGKEAPKGVYSYRPYLLSFCASWASAMYGYDSAFIGGTINLPSFQRRFGLDTADANEKAALQSNIVSTFQAGAFFGCAGGFFIAERFGRKALLYAAAAVFIVGAGIQMVGQLGALYAGRALTGLGVGSSAMVLPIYVSECSPPLIRGRLVGVFEVMLQLALVFGFWVNYGVNENVSPATAKQWLIPIAVQLVPAGLLIMGLVVGTVESPRWLVSKNRMAEATKSLSWIRNLPPTHPYVVQELAVIEAGVNHELESTGDGSRSTRQMFAELAKPGVRNRMYIALAMMLFQNLTGINVLNYFSPTIFRAIGLTGTSIPLLATGVFGIVKMFATLIYITFIVDRFGRRLPLLVGAIGAGFAMFYLGIYSAVSHSLSGAIPPRDAGANAAVAMIYIYAVFYGASWNGIPWLFSSEVLPTRCRTLGMAIAVCWQWATQFMVVYSLPYMIKDIKWGTFVFYGVATVGALVFAWLFVPETKGVVLEDMGLLFGREQGGSGWAWRAGRNYEDEMRRRREMEASVGEGIDKEGGVVVEKEGA